MNYTIYTVTIPGYPHTRCFEELSLGLASGFRELGYSAKETGVLSEIEGRAIVLGAHLINAQNPISLPQDVIIYNTEQMSSTWTGYADLLKKHTVWDYSIANVEALRAAGIDAHYCGVGYAPELEKIPKTEEIHDVVFYGSMNERRAVILEKLIDAGINLYIIPFGTYGAERDAILARAKVVLNIHYYDDAPFEIVRCSYLCANKIFFLSESGPGFTEWTHTSSKETLAQAIEYYLSLSPEKRGEATAFSYEQFKQTRQSDYIKAALSELPASRPHIEESV